MQDKFRLLDSGHIAVEHDTSSAHLKSLVEIGQRENPRRPFLFVSKILGRHVPVKPSIMKSSFEALAQKVIENLDGEKEVSCIGMAETAVCLGAGVHRELSNLGLNSMFIASTRYPVGGEKVFCEFKEEHSHAQSHFIHMPKDEVLRDKLVSTKTLVLIDDESSTGKTFLNLTKNLVNSGLSGVKKIVTVTLTDWSNGAVKEELAKNEATKHIDVLSVSLVAGSYSLVDHKRDENKDKQIAKKIDKNNKSIPLVNMDIPFNECRMGMSESTFVIDEAQLSGLDGKILLLATGEYSWQPFLIAEHLESKGLDVVTSSTSRSPAYIFGALKSKLELKDNYGQDIDMFAYNLHTDDYDHVVIVSETPKESFDKSFLLNFKNVRLVTA